MPADGSPERGSLVARLSQTFHQSLFQPMFQRAPVAPADVRLLIAEFRSKLDLLDAVIATAEDGSAAPSAFASVQPRTISDGDSAGYGDADDIGRNQRSRVRELHLLEAMARDTRPYSLQQLLAALAQKGFSDSSAAVVSQLHRLKKVGLVNQPANGMYEITLDGLGHVRNLRASFGALAGDVR